MASSRRTWKLVEELALLAGAVSIVNAVFTYGQKSLSTRLGLQIIFDLGKKVFAHAQRLSIGFFVRTKTGAMMNRLNNDMNGVGDAFTDILSTAVSSLVTIPLVLITMFAISWKFTLASLILVPRLRVARARDRPAAAGADPPALRPVGADEQLRDGAPERERRARLRKIFGRPEDDLGGLRAEGGPLRDVRLRTNIYARSLSVALGLLASLAAAVLYGWGGALAIRHLLDIGMLVALASYLDQALHAPDHPGPPFRAICSRRSCPSSGSSRSWS